MKRRRSVLAAALFMTCAVVLIMSSAGCPAPPPSKRLVRVPVILMILADVTTSLEKGEVEQVAKLTADVLDKFPDNTDYVVYPIQWETERPTAIDEQHPDLSSESSLSEEDKNSRRQDLAKRIREYYANVNKKQPVDRTCILNTLEVADKHFNQAALRYPPGKSPCMEFVIISDMIEQCGINPLNRSIDLREQSVNDAIALVQNIPAPNLARLHITVIIPTAEQSTPYAQHRPRVGDLERFWNTVFERCGFKPDDMKNFNWLPTVPGRFDHVCQ